VTPWANGVGAALIERLGWSLVHSVWQGAAVALLVAGVFRWLRRSSAQARYATACGALLAMLVLPLVTLMAGAFGRDAEFGSSASIHQSASKSNVLSDHNPSTSPIEDVRKRLLAAEADRGRGGSRPSSDRRATSFARHCVGTHTSQACRGLGDRCVITLAAVARRLALDSMACQARVAAGGGAVGRLSRAPASPPADRPAGATAGIGSFTSSAGGRLAAASHLAAGDGVDGLTL
jgi:hypothetical protein